MLDTTSEVAGFWAEEDVEDELDAVDDGHEPVDPAVGEILGYETWFDVLDTLSLHVQ